MFSSRIVETDFQRRFLSNSINFVGNKSVNTFHEKLSQMLFFHTKSNFITRQFDYGEFLDDSIRVIHINNTKYGAVLD